MLLSGQDNMLIYLTGIPYSSMLVYHRWVARIMFLHACCWTEFMRKQHELSDYYKMRFFACGITGLTAVGCILFQATHVFRALSYETFVLLHIALVIIFTAVIFHHVYDFGFVVWLYVSWVLWAADYAKRILRILWFGMSKADVELLNERTLRVTVPDKNFDMYPGCYAFLTPYGFWQSHPFSAVPSQTHPGLMMFTIRIKKGLSRHLQRHMSSNQGKNLRIRVGVEGPYGHCHTLEKYSDVLFFAGGTGVTGILSYALHMSSKASSEHQNVRLIWVMKSLADYEVFAGEVDVLRARNNISVEIYTTCGTERVRSVGSVSQKTTDTSPIKEEHESSEDISAHSVSQLNGAPRPQRVEVAAVGQDSDVVFKNNRPLCEEIIMESAMAEQTRNLAIMACGPPILCDDVRAFTARAMWKSNSVLYLFEDLQVW